jgi:addiction module HigA family antidote
MVFVGEVPKGFPSQIARVARRKLAALDVARRLDDLRQPPGNRLEALVGNRAGQHSIRINDQWRICFVWRGSDAYDVEIVDYHQEMTVKEIIRREDLHKIDFSRDATGEKLPPVTPGEVLREDFLSPLGLSGRTLAAELGIPANRVTEIIAGRRAITAETALILAERFGTTAEFWLGLQMAYDLEQARRARAA